MLTFAPSLLLRFRSSVTIGGDTMAGSVLSLLASLEDDERDWFYRSVIAGVLNVPPRGFNPVWLSCDLVRDAAIGPFRRLAGHDASLSPAAVRVVAETCLAWAAERAAAVPVFAQFAKLPYHVLGADDYEMDSEDEAYWAAQDAKLSPPVATSKHAGDVAISGDSLGFKGALDTSKWDDLRVPELRDTA